MKKIAIILSICLLLIGWGYIKYCHLGFLVDVNRISYKDVCIRDNYVTVNVVMIDSALSYSRNTMRIEDQKAYIKIYSALPSKFREEKDIIKIDLDTAKIEEILIEDKTNKVSIWSR